MCKEMAKELRSKLKEIGYNRNMVGVTSSYNSIDVTVKSLDVDFKAIENLANTYEKIDRDYATGEILCGCNTFVNVDYANSIKEDLKEKYSQTAEEFWNEIENSKDDNCVTLFSNENYYISYSVQGHTINLLEKDKEQGFLNNICRYACWNVEYIKEALMQFFLSCKFDILNNSIVEENKTVESEIIESSEESILVEGNANIETENNIEVTVKFNLEKNGIELYFNDKPSVEIREMLKSNGYRWAKYNKCWYCKDTTEQREILKNLGWLNDNNENKITVDSNSIVIAKVEDKNIQIDERLAKRSKENMSFSDYVEGSATKEYNNRLQEVKAIIEDNKTIVDNVGKQLLDNVYITYKNKYADWVNKHNANGAGHVSVLISGAGNYPMKKHEKYLNRESKLWEEYKKINDLDYKIDKIVRKYKLVA